METGRGKLQAEKGIRTVLDTLTLDTVPILRGSLATQLEAHLEKKANRETPAVLS